MRLKHLRFFAVECFTNDSRKDDVECFIYHIGEILELDVPGCAFENLRRFEVSSEYSSP